MYNKTIIRFGFCDIQNNQGLGKGYQPQSSASAFAFQYKMYTWQSPENVPRRAQTSPKRRQKDNKAKSEKNKIIKKNNSGTLITMKKNLAINSLEEKCGYGNTAVTSNPNSPGISSLEEVI